MCYVSSIDIYKSEDMESYSYEVSDSKIYEGIDSIEYHGDEIPSSLPCLSQIS